jgi:plastocyanin
MNHRDSLPFLVLPIAALLLALAPPPGSAATHDITQTSLSFSPDSLDVEVGDTVNWHHTSSSHTVTNGEGAADPEAGTLFDEPLSAASPLVTFTFTEEGRVPFFCRPHEVAGMKGVIIVGDPTSAVEPGEDEQPWGRIKARYR